MTTLKEGDKAPAFSMPRDGNGTVSLADYAGKPLVLYFYPKDSTPGCTQEAKDFRDHLAAFEAAGAAILGISKDSVKKHENFIAKNELNFPLGADLEGDVCEAYGVWVEKSMYGRKYMGIQRATFLIDGQGVIRKIWPKVKIKGHAEDVLEAIKTL